VTSRTELFKVAREGYRRLKPVLESAVQIELQKLRVILNSKEVPFIRYEARLKPFESIRDNYERYAQTVGDGVQLGEFLKSSTDLIGVRFITLYNREVDVVDEALSEVLKGAAPERVFSIRDRMKGSEFGYRATHWKYLLDDKVIKQAVDGCEIGVEVQVRSVLSDAWAVHSRRLVYKNDILPPEAVLREFARASAVLEGLDAKMDDIASMIGAVDDRTMVEVLGEFETRAALQSAISGELEEGAVRGIMVDVFGEGDVSYDNIQRLLDDTRKAWNKFGGIPFGRYGIEDDSVKLRIVLFGLDSGRYAALVPIHSRKKYSDLLAIGGS
jgi:ppGpp synthetase/RelA/SpoT-type nucleotidyltranferase